MIAQIVSWGLAILAAFFMVGGIVVDHRIDTLKARIEVLEADTTTEWTPTGGLVFPQTPQMPTEGYNIHLDISGGSVVTISAPLANVTVGR